MRELDGDSLLMLGFGREGRAMLKHLSLVRPDLEVGVADRNEDVAALVPPGPRVFAGEGYLDAVDGYDMVVRSPGIRPDLPELAGARRVTSTTNVFLASAPGTVIGVTGTKGKSTTSSLLARILRDHFPDVRLVGNIGKPALDALPGAGDDTIFVMELSSQQLVDARYSPRMAVVLSIFPEHLDFHDTVAAYEEAKSRIVAFQGSGDVVVAAKASPAAVRIAEASPAGTKKLFAAGDESSADAFVRDDSVVLRVDGDDVPLMPVADISLRGAGNLANVLAAACAAAALDVPRSSIRASISDFEPLPHRLQPVGEAGGVSFVNDSLATIPEAVVNALDALGDDVETLIVGGHDRGLDYSALALRLRTSEVRTLILLAAAGRRIWDAVAGVDGATPPAKVEATSMEEAVEAALRVTSPGRTCLLSPGAASYGMFRDYAERGDRFAAAVRAAGGAL